MPPVTVTVTDRSNLDVQIVTVWLGSTLQDVGLHFLPTVYLWVLQLVT